MLEQGLAEELTWAPPPFPSPPQRGREPPDILTRFAPLNPGAKTDPSPQPSPLRKERGGFVGWSLANRGSGKGASGSLLHPQTPLPNPHPARPSRGEGADRK